jgi:hypothetical protein
MVFHLRDHTGDSAGVSFRYRANWHGLVFVLFGFAVFYALKQAGDAYFVNEHGAAYREAHFVIDRVMTTDGKPPQRWAEGRIEPGGVPYRFEVMRTLKGQYVLADDPAVPAQSGQRMRIWWTEGAGPVSSVASMRCLPDPSMIPVWIIFAIALFFSALGLTMRAGEFLQKTSKTEILFDE